MRRWPTPSVLSRSALVRRANMRGEKSTMLIDCSPVALDCFLNSVFLYLASKVSGVCVRLLVLFGSVSFVPREG